MARCCRTGPTGASRPGLITLSVAACSLRHRRRGRHPEEGAGTGGALPAVGAVGSTDSRPTPGLRSEVGGPGSRAGTPRRRAARHGRPGSSAQGTMRCQGHAEGLGGAHPIRVELVAALHGPTPGVGRSSRRRSGEGGGAWIAVISTASSSSQSSTITTAGAALMPAQWPAVEPGTGRACRTQRCGPAGGEEAAPCIWHSPAVSPVW